MNHGDMVYQLYQEQPAEKTVGGAFRFLLRVLDVLPPQEKVGLVRSQQGNENTVWFNGEWVRAARLIYPDGTIIKILTDVPATNGPAWNYDDLRPDLYIPYSPPAVQVIPMPPPVMITSDITVELEAVNVKLDALKLQLDANTEKVQQQIDQAIKNFEKSAKDALALVGGIPGLLKILGK